MAKQVYQVYSMYVTDRGLNYYSNPTYFHYLKDAKMYAYKYVRTHGREAYSQIVKNDEMAVGTMIGRNGKTYWEAKGKSEVKVGYGGRKKKKKEYGISGELRPFGL